MWERVIRKIIRMLPPSRQHELRRSLGMVDVEWSLRRLARLGFAPRAIVDIGAYVGDWTRLAKSVFPDSRVLMVEAQAEKRDALEAVKRRYAPSVDYVIAALGARALPAVPFSKMETGSSFLEEQSNVARRVETIPMRTLDEVIGEAKLDGVSLLKLDVQGYELEVLKGAPLTMIGLQAILLEVSLLPYNKGGPLLDDVVAFMKQRGFLAYDICSIHCFSQQTFQTDMIFVKADSPWRISWFEY